ncbi:MAG TPA: glycosyltransferase [Bryobacteraceae bacterium]|nr:glycosyltransferase [Bryobacteraceae bacterium]
MPAISVIIPNYKRADLLRKAVVSLFAQDLDKRDYEIIVVDSTPDDSVVRMLAEIAPQAECSLRWFTKKPEGPALSRHLGVQNARGRVLAFLDSDCEAAPCWLRAGLAAFSPGIGLVQGHTEPDPAGRLGTFTHFIIVRSETFLYESCNIFYLREAYEQAGGFRGVDDTPVALTPTGGEDTDLAWRVRRLGWKSVFANEALVCHAVLPLAKTRWFYDKRKNLFPGMVKQIPELRRFMYARYFYDVAQALFCLFLLGLGLALVHPIFLLFCLPYILFRSSEPSATLKGPLRLLRSAIYFPRDAVQFGSLFWSSVKARSLLL